jgi:transcription factor RLM1
MMADLNSQHGVPNEHKGPSDFNGGADDASDEEGDGTPPRGDAMDAHMIPPHFQGQPPFQHLRHHTPSASPPIPNGVTFATVAAQGIPRGHTPQPQMGSRPGSRNDMRRMPPNMMQPVGPPGPPQGHPVNGFAYMPQPAIYNPQNPMPQTMPQPGPQYPYPPPQPHAHMQPYMDDRRSSLPPNFPPQGPPQVPTVQRHSVSPPQPHTQQLPVQSIPHTSPPQPQHQPMPSPPQPPPQPQPVIHEPPPAPMVEPKPEPVMERPTQPLLTTEVKKLPAGRKQHSIFTPIDENRSMLSQHLAAFHAEPLKSEAAAASRSQSIDLATVARTNASSSPPMPKRSESTQIMSKTRGSISSIPETTFTPPSRQNSLRIGGGGGARPRLRVEIPDEGSDGASATAESASPKNSTETGSQSTRRNGADSHSSGMVLPPPSPSASTILSAGATGPPNPFARPPPHQPNNVHIDTPVSALPSRFMNNEFLPSPSSFYPEWNLGSRGDSNTLPSPLNFATPIAGTGPSFLRDDNALKRKSPDLGMNGPTSDPLDHGSEPKRIKVDG